MNHKIIIGTGTGRCGTKSFAYLLNKQYKAYVTHEMFKWNVPYLVDNYYVNELLQRLAKRLKDNYILIGDIAHQWLWYANDLLKYNVRMIYLWRDKKEVEESYQKKIEKNNYNHWLPHTNIKWDRAYPKFNNYELEKFIDHSQSTAIYLQGLYPMKFKIYHIDILNDAEMQKDLFKWIGIDKPIIDTKIHKNKS